MNLKLLINNLALGCFLLISCNKNSDIKQRPELGKFYEIVNNSSEITSNDKVKILTETLKYSSESQNDSLFLEVIDQLLIYYKDSPSRKIEFCLKAIAVAENMRNYPKLLKYFDVARNGYLRINEYPLALKYAKKHLELTYKIGNKKEQLLSINNLGIHYNAKQYYDSAMVYYNLMNLQNKNPIDSTILNVFWINSGIIHGKNKAFETAIENFTKSLEFNDGYRDKSAYVQNELAKLYFSKGDYQKAVDYAKNAEVNAIDLNNSLKISIDKTLYEIYKRKNDLRNENLYFQKFTKAQMHEDSIRIERSNELLDLDYKSQKQELSLVELNQKVEKESYNNKVLLISIASAGIVLALLVLFINNLRKSSDKIKIQKTEIEQLNQNLEAKVELRTAELLEANNELIKKNFEITEALFKGQTIERKRVAAELHDNLGSTLSALKWRLGALNSEELSPTEKAIYNSIKEMMSNAYNDVRTISHNLLPAEFESKGLIGALTKYIGDLNENHKIQFIIKTEGDLSQIGKKTGLELYSITMELITNILKHANAKNVQINLIEENQKYHLSIVDDGKGMDTSLIKNGMGIKQIESRSKSIGFSFQIESTMNEGTRFWLYST